MHLFKVALDKSGSIATLGIFSSVMGASQHKWKLPNLGDSVHGTFGW